MRVLFISVLLPPVVLGGYETECKEVVDGLASRGHEVAVLASNYHSDAAVEEANYPVWRRLHLIKPFDTPVQSSMRWRKRATEQINRQLTHQTLAEFKPDIVYVWSQQRMGMGSVWALRESKTPFAWRLGDEHLMGLRLAPFSLSARGLYRYIADRLFLRRYSVSGMTLKHVSLVSETLRQHLVEEGIRFEDAQVIYKGISLAHFPLKTDPGALSNPVRLLYVGRLYSVKGVTTLIKAAQEASKRCSQPLTLSIVGAGDPAYIEELKRLAADGPIPVSFPGFVPHYQLSPIYQSHDILVFPSERSKSYVESLGATHHEAMASGLPVISTDCGGQCEFLIDRINSLVFASGAVHQLADQICTLVKDSELRERLAKEGRRLVEERFDLSDYIQRTEAFLVRSLDRWSK